jgi:uroporphyrin-III C-methyltransferase/precorrin-2 dehydrogenase/sirohydrochlorin ferrochelatase
MGQSLTTRGNTDTLVLATGTGCADAPFPDCVRFAGPGTTTAIYMGVRQADRICAALRDRGFPANAMVDVCVDVAKASQRLLSDNVATLPARLKSEKIEGCALILVKWPLAEQAVAAHQPVLMDAMS